MAVMGDEKDMAVAACELDKRIHLLTQSRDAYEARAVRAESEVREMRETIDRLEAEKRVFEHEIFLVEKASERGITDCSTPSWIRVQNICDRLTHVEVENEMLRAIVDEVCRRDSRLAADVLRAVSQAPALRSAA